MCLKVSDRPKWSGANMAQALGHLQLEETGSVMEGLMLGFIVFLEDLFLRRQIHNELFLSTFLISCCFNSKRCLLFLCC